MSFFFHLFTKHLKSFVVGWLVAKKCIFLWLVFLGVCCLYEQPKQQEEIGGSMNYVMDFIWNFWETWGLSLKINCFEIVDLVFVVVLN